LGIAARILLDVLAGLEAAHTAVSERGRALGIVHRDVSPQNVICGADGLVRVVDFGIAKAEGKLAVTRAGEIKGKVAYMAPEQLRGEEVDCRADLYAVGIVLWELLAGRRLFETSADFAAALDAARARVVPSVQHYADVPSPVEAVLMRALAANPSDRYESAATMADALENVAGAATAKDLAAFVNRLGASELSHLGARVADVEQLSEVASLAAMEASAMDPAHAQPFSTVPVTAPIAEDTIREARPSAPETSSSETAPSAPAWTPAAIANPSHAAPTRISAAPLALSSPQPVTSQPPAPSAIPQSSPQVRPAASTVSAPRRGLVLATVALLFVATMLVLAFGFRGGLVRRLLGGGRGHPSAEEPGSAPNGAERPAHPGRRRASP
jgi:serine/threonine-protein kinase